MTIPKRERTRAALAKVALELYEKQGFEETTVEEITKAVGVSQMTFFRNFPTKADVCRAHGADIPFERYVGLAPFSLGAQESAYWAFSQVSKELEAGKHRQGLRVMAIIARTPSLHTEIHGPCSNFVRRIDSALVGRGIPAFEAKIVAGSVIGAMAGALQTWASTPGSGLYDVVCEAIATVCPSLVTLGLLPDNQGLD